MLHLSQPTVYVKRAGRPAPAKCAVKVSRLTAFARPFPDLTGTGDFPPPQKDYTLSFPARDSVFRSEVRPAIESLDALEIGIEFDSGTRVLLTGYARIDYYTSNKAQTNVDLYLCESPAIFQPS